MMGSYISGTSRDNLLMAFNANYMKLLSDKFGDYIKNDGKPMIEDPSPLEVSEDVSISNDDSTIKLNSLKGERVDPHLRIY